MIAESNAKKPVTQSWRWPLILVGLLTLHTGGMVVAGLIATRDRTFAVPTDYYGRAVRWDQRQATLRTSAHLGWNLSINASGKVDPLGKRVVSFTLTDVKGEPVPAASMDVIYFHHAHGQEVQHLDFTTADAADPHRFSGVVPMRYAGLWEFDFAVKSQGKTFIANTTQWITNDGK